jgi:hypothetical protein
MAEMAVSFIARKRSTFQTIELIQFLWVASLADSICDPLLHTNNAVLSLSKLIEVAGIAKQILKDVLIYVEEVMSLLAFVLFLIL